jgi:hypothetical protein
VVVDPQTFGGPAGAPRIIALLAANGIPRHLVRRDDDLSLALSGPAR